MKIPIFQIDAFTKTLFRGNPAAVCPLEHWLPDSVMQSVAAENNLAETAFFVGRGGHYEIRWFTPEAEVDLCGHATLASAFVLFEAFGIQEEELVFISRSGPLKVRRHEGRLQLDFPAWEVGDYPLFGDLIDALGEEPVKLLTGGARDYIAVFRTEAEVRALSPDMDSLQALDRPGLVITAAGTDCDFVSRFFTPANGIPEDPVTGSSHCGLVPYWAKTLGRESLHARQVSKRGGELWCRLAGDRVLIAGHAVQVLQGLMVVTSEGGTPLTTA